MSDPGGAAVGRRVVLDKKAVFGWAMFDFANSAFTTVMVTAYFGLYFRNVIAPDRGFALWGVATWISQVVVILTAPLLGALADFSGAKKKFLLATYLGCSLLTISLGFVAFPGAVGASMAIFIVANICFASGENFVSAFLPEIAPKEMMGRISGLAWGLGYFGGIGSLLVATWILASGESSPEAHSRVWIMTGLWFLLAGIPTFLFVKERHGRESMPAGQTLWTIGFHRLGRTLRQIRRFRQLFRFLVVMAIYWGGVMAVVNFAMDIARSVLAMTTTQLGVFFAVLNVAAAIGAVGSGWLMDRIGSRGAIMLALTGWLVAIALIMAIDQPAEGEAASAAAVLLFWVGGNLVGLSMGSIFACSRALVGLFSPEDRAAEFFGLWGLFAKLGAAFGPLIFGLLADAAGLRVATYSLVAFFVVGLIGMRFVDEKEGRRAAASAG